MMVAVLAYLVYPAYLALAGYGVWTVVRWRRPYRPWVAGLDRRAQDAVRTVAGGLSLLVGMLTSVLFVSSGETHASLSEAFVTYLALSALLTGSALYTLGAVIWRGRSGFRLRVTGWLFLVVIAAIPSQLTLLLPLVVPLVLTLHELAAKDEAEGTETSPSLLPRTTSERPETL